MHIAIIGAGWYGCHLALALKAQGYDITLYEKESDIFLGVSGQFGSRLHLGPHYLRSPETRKNCQRWYEHFKKTYPELVIENEYSIFGLANCLDAEDNTPKVNIDTFDKVCTESPLHSKLVKPSDFGYENLSSAWDVGEASIALGKRLRDKFKGYLKKAGIKLGCNYQVTQLEQQGNQFVVGNKNSTRLFDKVINATGLQALSDHHDNPFGMEVIFQPCLSLLYEDTKVGEKPFSFIVMDGWYPCLMPLMKEDQPRLYGLTHGKWTIMHSCPNVERARKILAELSDEFVEKTIKNPSEGAMIEFWKEFANRFRYVGWEGRVIAKLKTKGEFRSAVTYEKNGIIYMVPGKVSHIFDVENEVNALLLNENILELEGYRYVQGGVLDNAAHEIFEKPAANEPNTCNLNTYEQLIKEQTLSLFSTVGTFFQQSVSHSAQAILDWNRNYYFELQCLAGIMGGMALLVTILLSVSVGLALLTASVITGGAEFCAYHLWTQDNIIPVESADDSHTMSLLKL